MNKKDIPDEVKAIFREVNRIQYNMLVINGWCVSCYKEPAALGVRCESCQATYSKKQEERNRKKGIKPWKAGGRGRPPKSMEEVEDEP